MTRRVIGVDPSFSGFGVSDGELTTSFAARGVTLREKCGSLYASLATFLDLVLGEPMLWLIEKPFIVAGKQNDRNPRHPFNMGYLMSHLDDLAESLDVEVLEIDHGKLKIFTTGTGAASKIDMATFAFEKWGKRFRNDNECDAFALYQYGCALQRGENPGVRLPKPKKVRFA